MSLLDIVILLRVVSRLGGYSINLGGGLIHLLLVIALVMFIFKLAGGRRVR